MSQSLAFSKQNRSVRGAPFLLFFPVKGRRWRLASLLSLHIHSTYTDPQLSLKKNHGKNLFQPQVAGLDNSDLFSGMNMDHNHIVKWPFPSLPQSQEGCYLTKYNCHFQTSFLYVLWPELYIPAAWDIMRFVCPCEQCCCCTSEGGREEGQSKLNRNSINTWLYVYLFFSSEKWIYQEPWQWKLSTFFLEEEYENFQTTAADSALMDCWLIGVLSMGDGGIFSLYKK